MARQRGPISARLRPLQNPPGRAEDCLRARAPGDKHAAYPLQPEHAQGGGGSVLGGPPRAENQPKAANASRARIAGRSSTGGRIACPVQRTEPDDALPIVTSAIDSGCIEPNASHSCEPPAYETSPVRYCPLLPVLAFHCPELLGRSHYPGKRGQHNRRWR